jgi:hypothetical protein
MKASHSSSPTARCRVTVPCLWVGGLPNWVCACVGFFCLRVCVCGSFGMFCFTACGSRPPTPQHLNIPPHHIKFPHLNTTYTSTHPTNCRFEAKIFQCSTGNNSKPESNQHLGNGYTQVKWSVSSIDRDSRTFGLAQSCSALVLSLGAQLRCTV